MGAIFVLRFLSSLVRKLLTTILAFLYLGISAGATVHLHYCMGKFVNVSFSNTARGICSNCGMQKHSKDNDCCRDVKVAAKITDSQHPLRFVPDAGKPFDIAPVPFYPAAANDSFPEKNNARNTTGIHSPPAENNPPLYLRHRVFRI